MKRLNNSGFSHILIFVVVAIILGLSMVAYRAVSSNEVVSDSAGTSAVPASVNTTADLNAASKALDTTSEDEVNPDQLDADLNAML